MPSMALASPSPPGPSAFTVNTSTPRPALVAGPTNDHQAFDTVNLTPVSCLSRILPVGEAIPETSLALFVIVMKLDLPQTHSRPLAQAQHLLSAPTRCQMLFNHLRCHQRAKLSSAARARMFFGMFFITEMIEPNICQNRALFGTYH